MAVKQTIAIIGAADNAGSALAKALAKGPYRLILFAHERERLAELGKQILTLNPLAEFETIDCALNASWEADTIIAAVGNQDKMEVAQKIKSVATQKIVLDVIYADDHISDNVIPVELQNFLPNSKVVEVLIKENATPGEPLINVFIAGRDKEALQTVKELLTVAGYRPIINRHSPVTEL
jgi:hypothetical protein